MCGTTPRGKAEDVVSDAITAAHQDLDRGLAVAPLAVRITDALRREGLLVEEVTE
jgi:hypothetical protein